MVRAVPAALRRSIYAGGGDEKSIPDAGVGTDRVVMAVFVLSGMRSVTGGLLLTGFTGGTMPTPGAQYLFWAILLYASVQRFREQLLADL